MIPDQPSRRELLRLGGATVAVSALIAACSSDGDPAAPVPAAEPEEEQSEDTPTEEADRDLRLLNTALSLEVLIVDTYQAAFDRALIGDGAVTDTVARFQQHHREHSAVLTAAIEAAGAEPFTTPNPVVRVALVDPAMAAIAAERDFLRLGRALEQAAAQLHVHLTTVLDTQELRSTTMSIAGVAARHARILSLLGDLGYERVAFVPADNPLPADAVVPG